MDDERQRVCFGVEFDSYFFSFVFISVASFERVTSFIIDFHLINGCRKGRFADLHWEICARPIYKSFYGSNQKIKIDMMRHILPFIGELVRVLTVKVM